MDDPYNAYITRWSVPGAGSGPLAGKTVAVKDNISTCGCPTSCGSRILAGYVPPYDAHAVALVKAAGGAINGKTNMDEFGMGTTTENSAYGPTLNPRDVSRVPGGSSGGSAAAVAGGLADLALGTDTGGSVRCPAAFCGIVGLKPTYGRVSRYGLVAYANSLETIGPMGRSVADISDLLRVIARPDPRDTTLQGRPYEHDPAPMAKGRRIGVPEEFFGAGVNPRVAETVRKAVETLAECGAEVVPVSMPSMRYALAAYYVTCTSEASSNLARYDGVRYGPGGETAKPWHDAFTAVRSANFGDEVRRRILLGTFALSAGYYGKYYGKAQTARASVAADFARLFADVDVLAGPTMPVVAPRLGELADPLSMYLADVLTVPANLAGVPAISVPCGTVDGLPVGLQLTGRPYDDEGVIDLAAAYEEATA
jgi:aspartyl-tRNA(Asn)/glutamyl-tRNA(Gln) amidotransferase subunit A